MVRVPSRERIRARPAAACIGLLLAMACHGEGHSDAPSPQGPASAEPHASTSFPVAPARSAVETPTSETSPFAPTVENPSSRLEPPAGSRGMVWIPGGVFSMGAFDPDRHAGAGCGDPTADAQPVHRV